MTEFHLNIYTSVIVDFFSTIVRKIFPFMVVVVFCQGCTLVTDGQNGEPLEMTSLFSGAHLELVRAHSTGSEADFTCLVQKIQPNLKRYASRVAYRCPFGAIDIDDYVQIGIIAIWRFMPGFKYLCPLCDERFINLSLYTNHCETIHGEVMEPVKTLEQWLTYEVKQYMSNELRSRFRRYNYIGLETDIISSEDDIFKRAYPGPDEMAISNQIVERIKELIKHEQNKRLKSFVGGCIKDEKPVDIFRSMVDEGLSRSTQSARVGVRMLRRRPNIWRLYRQALVG